MQKLCGGVPQKTCNKICWAHYGKETQLGFPGSLGALNCSGWRSRFVFVAERSQNIINSGHPKLRFECVYDNRPWIWHFKFVFVGKINGLDILRCSFFISEARAGVWKPFKPEFKVARRTVHWFYWVPDVNYSHFCKIFKDISKAQKKKVKTFYKT